MRHKHDPMSRRLLCQNLNVKPIVSTNGDAPTSELGVEPRPEQPVPLLYYFVTHFKSVNTKGS